MFAGQPLYRERLDAGARGWGLFTFAVVITAVAVSPKVVPVTVLAWIVNLVRFSGTEVRIEEGEVRVGRKRAPLSAFDPSTLSRANNTWPWRTLDPHWLGANPIWTKDSVRLTGHDSRGPVWLNVGTNDRDALVAALMHGIRQANDAGDMATVGTVGHGPQARANLPSAGWYPDPWNPVVSVRWWDGQAWTGHTHPRPGVTRSAARVPDGTNRWPEP